MREQIDQQRIEQFLQRLGREFGKAGRVYLVGGTTMVFEGLRQQTLDIDLAIEVSDDGFQEILPRMASDSLKQDPEKFQRNFEFFEKRWRDS